MPAHVGHREPPHVAERPGDRIADAGLIAPGQLARLIVDVDVAPAVVEVLEDLFDDDLALELDVAKLRRAEEIAQDLHAALDVPRVERDLIERVVAPGLGVQRAAQLLDRAVERHRRRVERRAAKQHVLEEVRQAVGRALFVARAGAHIEADRRAVQVRRLDGHHPQPVRQQGTAHPVRRLTECDGVVGQAHVASNLQNIRSGEARTKHAFATVVVFGGDGRDGARDGVRVRGGRPLTPAAPLGVAGEHRGIRRSGRNERPAQDGSGAWLTKMPPPERVTDPSTRKAVRLSLVFFPKFLPALSWPP